MAHDVSSATRKDKPTADAVCATLEGRGIRCWVAPRDILPGTDWGEAIIDAIEQSRVMILIFSGHANESPQIKREVERAVNKNVTVVPLRIENVPMSKSLEYFVSTPHWMDALNPPLEQHLNHLADTLKLLLSRPARVRPIRPAPWGRTSARRSACRRRSPARAAGAGRAPTCRRRRRPRRSRHIGRRRSPRPLRGRPARSPRRACCRTGRRRPSRCRRARGWVTPCPLRSAG